MFGAHELCHLIESVFRLLPTLRNSSDPFEKARLPVGTPRICTGDTERAVKYRFHGLAFLELRNNGLWFTVVRVKGLIIIYNLYS